MSVARGRTIQSTNGRGRVTDYNYHEGGGGLWTTTRANAAPGGGDLVTQTAYTLTPDVRNT